MKYLLTTLAATASLLSAVTADFEIYRVGIGGNGITENVEGWQVYQDEANCDTVLDWIWPDTDDASGRGVRCEGDGCGRSDDDDPANIEILEMNFEGYHWTYYRDRNGGDLVDTNDVPVGKCYPFPAAFLTCGLTVDRLEGYRKLRCDGIDVNAEQINSNRFSLRGRSLPGRN
ncbi:uncharacterized protein J4E87_005882 [Alternaria ethzedia]|uniref:uncharacterized protein n=1 Tax=Alternaria viburni TaxID=566460 RepID=UPI0020C1F366|nr:uncharacterized protein J4E79_001178 [Alternaria viburni]XP_049232528.1 uncharacterized protein J4E87_005882 [Alternaria ethzedia]KAI4622789.1 hypothetical protein J4E87_005882 [Alternaria ethzedia]KAI4669135.1 hypothetical protein J4E79_001178 [Alternaria viburni]KAI4709438.1 hypothetical protein J4E89_005454 [Alternaria sp. Ai002NY15]